MSEHPALCETLLEFAEPPTRSLQAGRALVLCVHELPCLELDDTRILGVFERLAAVEQTQIQDEVRFGARRISRTPHGVNALRECGVSEELRSWMTTTTSEAAGEALCRKRTAISTGKLLSCHEVQERESSCELRGVGRGGNDVPG